VTVQVPSWRNDIAVNTPLDPAAELDPPRAQAAAKGRDEVEAEADLIGEVLRLRGLDAVPPVSMAVPGPVPQPTLTPRQARTALAQRTLAAQGLAECVTFSFMAAAEAALFGQADPALRVANPIAADLDQMRPTPVATLALAAARNAARGWGDVGLFEIGPAFRGTTPEAQPMLAAGLRAGSTPRHWAVPARGVDAMDAKADVWAVLSALGVPMEALSVTSGPAGSAPGFYHPGQSGVVRQGPKVMLATFGALHPRVLAALDIAGPAVAFEVMLDAIPDPKRRRKAAPDLPAFMPVRRDFSFVVDAGIPAEAALKAARGAERSLIASVGLFDAYEGDRIEPGRKALGIEVVFQPRERTLTDAEIEAACAKLAAAVEKATGGRLR
jgi:phenylalanyl-tRNA synthetase beta chain